MVIEGRAGGCASGGQGIRSRLGYVRGERSSEEKVSELNLEG